MSSPDIELSVVMPAYNEGQVIDQAVLDIRDHILAHITNSELVIVDDGSTDDTLEKLSRLATTDARIRVISQCNGGHGPALIRAADEAHGRWLLLLDSDRQVDVSSFPTDWQDAQSVDAFLGVRKPRRDPLFRLFVSAVMAHLIRLLYGASPKDAGAPYKLVRVEHWHALRQMINHDCIIPSVLLAVFLQQKRLRVVQRPIRHLPRVGSVSTLNARRLTGFSRHAANTLVAFRARLRNNKLNSGTSALGVPAKLRS